MPGARHFPAQSTRSTRSTCSPASGGVTSLPAAIAVWALVRPRVFVLYLGLSLTGALAAGLLFQLWQAL